MAASDMTPLTDVQREIMEIIWSLGEATVSEVRSALPEGRVLARNTVQTTLVRLEEKGWLKHSESGQAYVYSANRPRRVSLGAKVSQMIDRLFAGSPEDMVTAMIEYRGLTPDEAKRIGDMIDKAEKKHKRSSRQRGNP